jgi:hypothetical protein
MVQEYVDSKTDFSTFIIRLLTFPLLIRLTTQVPPFGSTIRLHWSGVYACSGWCGDTSQQVSVGRVGGWCGCYVGHCLLPCTATVCGPCLIFVPPPPPPSKQTARYSQQVPHLHEVRCLHRHPSTSHEFYRHTMHPINTHPLKAAAAKLTRGRGDRRGCQPVPDRC